MKNFTDNEVIREAIELYLVQHFENLEMAGTVELTKLKKVNYFSVDLNNLEWDGDVEKLHLALKKYLIEWARVRSASFNDLNEIANLTIEYLLPEKEGTIQNVSKLVRLFYLPRYYRNGKAPTEQTSRNKFILTFYKFWNNILIRNAIITGIPAAFAIALSIYKSFGDKNFVTLLSKSFDYVNVASGIIASFVLGYLINKVLLIRQDKIKRVDEIRNLSDQLTYFRSICFNLSRDHNFWNSHNPYIDSFKHGDSIKSVISYEEYYYPNYNNDPEYAKFRSVLNDNLSNPIVLLVLQLEMMAGDVFLDSGLTYTDFPPGYIYSQEEMERFAMFADANHIWYCCSEGKYFPEIFPVTHGTNEILEEIRRIDPSYKKKVLTKKKLEKVSLDFQYRIIPKLLKLVRLNEAPLPIAVKYFQVTFTLILLFGLIIPSLGYVFISNKVYSYISTFIVIAIIGHILLSLKYVLQSENMLDHEDDY